MPTRGRVVLLVGATGLVGGELLRQLLADREIARVVVLARRPVAAPSGTQPEHAAKLEAHIAEFDRLESSAEAFNGVEQVFCALGTTIRRAGSRERFRRVDRDYVVATAALAQRLGARHLLLVSAIGADPASRVFYNRVKGEVERDVSALGYRSVTIIRPSLLLGDRREFRLGEAIAKRFAWALRGRWKPVQARAVAAALVRAAEEDLPGVRVVESADIAGV